MCKMKQTNEMRHVIPSVVHNKRKAVLTLAAIRKEILT